MNGDMETNDSNRTRRRWLFGAASLGVLALAIVWWPGCRTYPPVGSKESLELLKLLYSACNTKDPARLSRVEEGVAKLSREGKMTLDEKRGFDEIIATAKSGEWKAAEDAAYKFSQDQVGQGTTETRLPNPKK